MAIDSHEQIGIALPPQVVGSGTDALASALAMILDHGHPVASNRPFREVLNAQIVIRDPYARLLAPGWTSFQLRVAVARVIWHLRASSSVEEIAHYEPRAASYSDDGSTLPGSNVGARLRTPIDQLQAAIDRLRDDPSSRRAAMVVWRPEDAVRVSRDIPCTFGLTFHIRDGRLITTAMMRSNNALRLFPYNIFELGMFGEIVAAELDVLPGPYVHIPQSLHLYEDELEEARRVVESQPSAGHPMPAMRSDGDLWEQVRRLLAYEQRSRHGEDVMAEAAAQLQPYWLAFLAAVVPGGARLLRRVSPEHPFMAHLVRPQG